MHREPGGRAAGLFLPDPFPQKWGGALWFDQGCRPRFMTVEGKLNGEKLVEFLGRVLR